MKTEEKEQKLVYSRDIIHKTEKIPRNIVNIAKEARVTYVGWFFFVSFDFEFELRNEYNERANIQACYGHGFL